MVLFRRFLAFITAVLVTVSFPVTAFALPVSVSFDSSEASRYLIGSNGSYRFNHNWDLSRLDISGHRDLFDSLMLGCIGYGSGSGNVRTYDYLFVFDSVGYTFFITPFDEFSFFDSSSNVASSYSNVYCFTFFPSPVDPGSYVVEYSNVSLSSDYSFFVGFSSRSICIWGPYDTVISKITTSNSNVCRYVGDIRELGFSYLPDIGGDSSSSSDSSSIPGIGDIVVPDGDPDWVTYDTSHWKNWFDNIKEFIGNAVNSVLLVFGFICCLFLIKRIVDAFTKRV